MYKHISGYDGIYRISDNSTIPADPTLIAWQEYQDWIKAGNMPLPADPVLPVVPQQVTRYQAQAALLKAGMLAEVESMMIDPATDDLTRLAWHEALAFKRQSPMVLAMAARLGMTDAQLDALFTSAGAIE